MYFARAPQRSWLNPDAHSKADSTTDKPGASRGGSNSNPEHDGTHLEAVQGHSIPTPAPGEDMLIELRTELESTQSRLAETHDRMLRIAADADNARKRWDKEREDIRKYTITDFARELLPVIDAFDKAMTLIEKTTLNSETEEGKGFGGIIEGVQMVSKVFHESIKKHGIERLPGSGEPFNPEYHNAIARVVDSGVATDTVVEEFVTGYKIGDRVLRTALVKVATKD
jgi:molecular chaperone GrpE